MDPTGSFEGIRTIRTNANKITGMTTIAQDRSVQRFMEDTMERISVAARGNTEGSAWGLTPFGLAIRPAIIYMQEMCTLLGTEPPGIVGNVSIPTTDASGDIISTPAAKRIALLKAIYDALEESGTEEIDFQTAASRIWIFDVTDVPDSDEVQETDKWVEVDTIEVADSTLSNHLRNLAASKLIEVKMSNTTEGEFVKYRADTDRIEDLWTPARKKYSMSTFELWQQIKTAVISLSKTGSGEFGVTDVNQKLQENGFGLPNWKNILPTILSELSTRGYLINTTGLSDKKRSIVKLTPLGTDVYEQVAKPLYDWFMYPEKVPAINQAAASYANNPEAYKALVHQIALNFRDYSPYVNADPVGKMSEITKLIKQNNGQLTAVEIAARLGLTRWNAYDLCHELARAGEIHTEPDPNSRTRKPYWVTERPKRLRRHVAQKAS